MKLINLARLAATMLLLSNTLGYAQKESNRTEGNKALQRVYQLFP